MEYAPSKEFFKKLAIVISLIVCLIIIGILFGSKLHFNKTSDKGSLVIVKDIVEKDTDADGLPDWQETLWGFDPKKADTNADGKTDLEEAHLLQGRLATQNKDQLAAATEAAKTDTGRFATDIVQLVTSLYQRGNLSNDDITTVTQKVQEYIRNQPPEKLYTQTDLSIVPLDRASAENYLKGVDAAFKKYPIKAEEYENIIISVNDYLKTEEGRTKLTALATKYSQLRDMLLAVKIPKGAETVHVEVVNSINQIAEMFTNMTAYETDSIRTLSSLMQFEDKVTQLSQSMASLQDLIFNS